MYKVLALSVVLLLSRFATASEPPQRVVSLDLCTDWLISQYADPTQVVGYSALSAHSGGPEGRTLMPLHDGHLESIIALKPDLVLVGQYNAWALRSRLKQLGLPVEILPLPTTLIEVDQQMQLVAKKLGHYERYVDYLSSTKPIEPHGETMLILGANGIATGIQTFENQLIEYAGWTNYITRPGYTEIDLEKVIAHPPSRLMTSSPDSAALANQIMENPIWYKVLNKKDIASTQYWAWQCPGPWTFQLVEQLKQWH